MTSATQPFTQEGIETPAITGEVPSARDLERVLAALEKSNDLWDAGKYDESVDRWLSAAEVDEDTALAHSLPYDLERFSQRNNWVWDTEALSQVILKHMPNFLNQRRLRWVNSRVLGFGLTLRLFANAYEHNFRETVRRQLIEFKDLTSIRDLDKTRIWPRVAESIAQVQAFQAWRYTIWGDIFSWAQRLALLFAFVAAIALAISVVEVKGAALTAVAVWPGSTVVFGAGYLVIKSIDFLADADANKRDLSVRLLIALFFVLTLVAFALGQLAFFGGDSEAANSATRQSLGDLGSGLVDIGHGIFLAGIGALSAFLFTYLLLYRLLRIAAIANEQKKLRELPEAEIIQTLCVILALIPPANKRWPGIRERAYAASELEWVGKRMEQELFRALTPDLATTQSAVVGQLKQATREMAADVYNLMPKVFLPQPGSQSDLQQKVAKKLVMAADGQWGQLERSEAQPEATPKTLRSQIPNLIAIIAPFVLIAIVAADPLELIKDQEFKSYVIVPAVAWALAKLASLFDPQWDKVLDSARGLSSDFFANRKAQT